MQANARVTRGQCEGGDCAALWAEDWKFGGMGGGPLGNKETSHERARRGKSRVGYGLRGVCPLHAGHATGASGAWENVLREHAIRVGTTMPSEAARDPLRGVWLCRTLGSGLVGLGPRGFTWGLDRKVTDEVGTSGR